MLTTGAISAMKGTRSATGKQKVAAVAAFLFLLLAGFFVTAQQARADTGADPGTAAGTVDPGSQVAPAPTDSQDAATSQANAADAIAAQPQQTNTLAADRTDSAGGETISQQ